MPFGHYWEMSYDPDWNGPSEKEVVKLTDFPQHTGPRESRVHTPGSEPVTKQTIEAKTFERCDIRTRLESCTFNRCTFDGCRFVANVWQRVKFSQCTFKRCHFFNLSCTECDFLDCTFSENSAGAEFLSLVRTQIDPTAFLNSLQTNAKHLPSNVTPEHQRSRNVHTKLKVASEILYSTQSTAGTSNFFMAYKEVVLYGLRARIEKHRFFYHENDKRYTRRRPVSFFAKSLPARLELLATQLFGFLTDWGQSLFRSFVYLGAVVLLFAAIYSYQGSCQPSQDNSSITSALDSGVIKAIEITLAAGYGMYRQEDQPTSVAVTQLANLCLGLYWYSLVVATITRRILR